MAHFLPPAASAQAGGVDLVLTLVHGLMAVLFVGWGAYFAYVLLRFRRGRQPQALPAGASGRLALGAEVGVVIAEGVLLVVFALPVWFDRMAAAPAAPNAIVIRVVGEQFAWNVHYPGADGEFGPTSPSLVMPDNPIGLDRAAPTGRDDIVLVNELHVPRNHPVVIQLSSKDVIHSFGVPAMRVKRDVIPGLTGSVWFTPTMDGQFDIACSQLCGMAHYRMHAVITVESDDAFRQFLAREALSPR